MLLPLCFAVFRVCCNRVLVFRFDAPLSYLSVGHFAELLREHAEARPGLHSIVIDASSINDIDPTAVRMLLALIREYNREGISILFALWKGEQRYKLLLCIAQFFIV